MRNSEYLILVVLILIPLAGGAGERLHELSTSSDTAEQSEAREVLGMGLGGLLDIVHPIHAESRTYLSLSQRVADEAAAMK